MQQRKSTAGRPTGTDGSDFSYRMVVDPRYTKVAQQKSRLRVLIIIQVISQVIGVLWALLTGEMDLDRLAVLSIIVGFISVITGELGRRRSNASLLRFYIVASSIAVMLSLATIARRGFSLEAFHDQDSSVLKKLELAEAGCVLLRVPLQICAIITTVTLIQNMSPKRAS
ncbi:uncharacterized protein LOC143883527 [Tasmannia lanceolata]|uniref:uncharacterized protein LOC143883527 n=1 Tax=Tasmannia lanceolata TaxID=3420 RepID=UPI004063DE7A